MIVMAFDISGRTGVAYGRAGGSPRATSLNLGQGLSEQKRFAKMISSTRFLLRKYKPDIVVYEAPVGGPKTSHFLVGVTACFVGTAAEEGFDPISVPINSVRKHFLGKHLTSRDFPGANKAGARRAIKRQVIARCQLLGWSVRDDDEADACAIWDYGCAVHGRAQSRPAGRLFNG